MKKFRKSFKAKVISVFLIYTILFQIVFPTLLLANEGPQQQEYSSFTQADDFNLVNKYSGSFSYNIPILAIPGKGGSYPINMGYSSGISPSSEASWVGLGWSLNVGALSLQLGA